MSTRTSGAARWFWNCVALVLAGALSVAGCKTTADEEPDDAAVPTDLSTDACAAKPETYHVPYPDLDGGSFDCAIACKNAVSTQESGRVPNSCTIVGDADLGAGDKDAGIAGAMLECSYTRVCL